MYFNLAAFEPPPLSKSAGKLALAPEAVFAMTLWGEARGESIQGKIVIASVILNRAARSKWWNGNVDMSLSLAERVRAVCLHDKQFSCWLPRDPNSLKMWEPRKNDSELVWNECVLVAAAALDGMFRNQSMGADHYHSYSVDMKSKWPNWADDNKLVSRIGHFFLYKLEP